MTSQTLIDAAGAAIGQQFPEEKIYNEVIEQGFERPCFFISASQKERPLLGERFGRTIELEIAHLCPEGEQASRENREILEEMINILQSLEVDGRPRRPLDIQSENKQEQGKIQVKARYSIHILRGQQSEKMGSLTHQTDIRI